MDREIKEKCVKVHASIWLDSSFWNFDGNVALKNKIGLIDKRLGYLGGSIRRKKIEGNKTYSNI